MAVYHVDAIDHARAYIAAHKLVAAQLLLAPPTELTVRLRPRRLLIHCHRLIRVLTVHSLAIFYRQLDRVKQTQINLPIYSITTRG